MMGKRLLALMLALLLAVPGAAFAQEAYQVAGFDGDDTGRVWQDHVFFSRMEALTGVKLEPKQYTDYIAYQKALTEMFAQGMLPDALLKASLTDAQLMQWRQSGQLIDLAPYLDSCMPNLNALLTQYPAWREEITLPDGSIAALPSLTVDQAFDLLWINGAWLQKLGVSAPNNAEELTNVLRLFRDRDMNQNGKTDDEKPLTVQGPWELKLLMAAFGLVANDYNLCCQDGQVSFVCTGNDYRAFVTWCRELYAEGLLSKESFQGGATAMERAVLAGNSDVLDETSVYGAFLAPSASVYVTNAENNDYIALTPLAYQGTRVWRDLFGQVTTGAFAVTSACKEPEALLRWVDTLYSEAGGILASIGQENAEYIIREDGTWGYNTQPEGSYAMSTPDDLSYMFNMAGSAAMPSLEPTDFLRRFVMDDYHNTVSELEKVKPYAVRPFPRVYLTAAQYAEAAQMQQKLGAYVDTQLASFVLGETPLTDDTWQAYENKLLELGQMDLVAFFQKIVDAR